ncbi:hypothetical protein GobsT_19480 [Gemmata obscuriglobus]|nr:hypothetical protein [Gemmata obscuriglobus]QEG27194.1 hypothetical protein GobsT_19480 [Gemmata obscuriglobus]VTS03881.1 Uncharacterized protein OS=Singulisphaera acidiphila (strain ATCC BAA-1392 / DSM 18658 / VKM B-2454 / MOB10) GN=Sinac_4535 PE=4 SV=1 [Gemmata obscuriglobus UQM 2246]
MLRYTPRWMTVLLVSSILAVTGCGGGESKPTGMIGPSPDQGLENLKVLLEQYQQDKGRPPAKMDEIMYLEPSYPAGVRGLVTETYVLIWGAKLQPGSTGVVAHEKAAAEKGGVVLLQDGTVKQMTAAEFKAAPKAK